MNFDESERYLYSLGNEVSAMKLGLENISGLLAALGTPHEKYLKVQVAGTNGKGSVCAFLDAIARSAAIPVGLYTSPHLVSITERIKINGIDISEAEFARAATRVREISEQLVDAGRLASIPTYFEQVTAIALRIFADAEVELALLETGLGGRYDATTAAGAKIVAITRIDLDHQAILGSSIAEIAAEKVAIIGEGSTVVVSEQMPEAMKVILDRCGEFDLKPVLAEDVRVRFDKGLVSLETHKAAYRNIRPGLLGRHQIENARVAILLAETLNDYFPISVDQIVQGLGNARHAGRLEYCGKYLFDGAHNRGGAEALARFVRETVNGPVTLVFGAMWDKEVSELATVLSEIADRVIVTKPANTRSFPADRLRTYFSTRFGENVYSELSVGAALTHAEKITPADGIILVTGSLYLVGEAKKFLESRNFGRPGLKPGF